MGKRYKCPYCNERLEREKLITHVEDKHEDLIPEGQTPTQVVFNSINHKTHGICVVCKKDTDWNEQIGRYNRLCGDPRCKEKLRKEFSANMKSKYGTDNLLTDTNVQERMLKNRKISSVYTFTDGGKLDYVGSYEKKFLEFVDKVMNISSKDMISPGPVIEYEFNGEIHHWITDFYYVPGNLVLDIKDGGKNPNTRPMEEYREKQNAKESAIRQLKKYNYLRLTDNNFGQFMEVLADLKSMSLDITQRQLITKINEGAYFNELSAGMSTVPPVYSSDACVLVSADKNNDERIALSSLDFNDDILIDDPIDGIKKINKKYYNANFVTKARFLYPKNESYYNLLKAFKNHDDCIYEGIYCNLSSFDTIITEDQIYFDKEFKQVANNGIDQNIFDLSKKVEKINDVLELDITDDSIGIVLPKMDLDKDYEVESILKNGKQATKIKQNNSVIAMFNKSAKELGIEDYEKIEEVCNILRKED